MKHVVRLAIVAFTGLCLFSTAAWGSSSGSLYCHKNGTGDSLGTVTIGYTMGAPNDSKEPARKCNEQYTTCQNQCQGCGHWADIGGISSCYDAQGICHGYCGGGP